MLEKFREELEKIHFEKAESKFLLALSGGLDSCVMAHLFHRSGINCEIAHCNFQLRGEESDADESFVRHLSALYGFNFHSEKFDAKKYAGKKKISIQMAARDIRYTWFNELIDDRKLDAVAVAHHANDVAETMLLNLIRGAGLAGMHGIASVNGRVFRPMLFATREEMEQYAKDHKLEWRDDSSNSEDKYIRNKIRLNVIPEMQKINPAFINSALKHANLMNGYEKLLDRFIENAELINEFPNHEGSIMNINFVKLLEFPSAEILLYHLLSKFGFNGEVCKDIITSRKPGAVFFGKSSKLVIGRDELCVFVNEKTMPTGEWIIFEDDNLISVGSGEIETEVLSADHPEELKNNADFTNRNIAFIDNEKLKFPLKIRKWSIGDFFQPLGMKGTKLVSDYMTDEKFSPAQKELVYLLFSGEEIVWVIGSRIDDRYKLTDTTRQTRKLIWKQL